MQKDEGESSLIDCLFYHRHFLGRRWQLPQRGRWIFFRGHRSLDEVQITTLVPAVNNTNIQIDKDKDKKQFQHIFFWMDTQTKKKTGVCRNLELKSTDFCFLRFYLKFKPFFVCSWKKESENCLWHSIGRFSQIPTHIQEKSNLIQNQNSMNQ